MLTLENVTVYYGSVLALVAVSMKVNEGEIVTLIGANGAGKTSTLRAISGLVPKRQGHVRCGEMEITGWLAHQVVGLGISHVPEGRQILAPLSVLENLHLGAYCLPHRAGSSEMQRDLDAVYELFPVLSERRKQRAGTLSGGEQQMLAIARALMGRPRVLLLDEPSLGLAPKMVDVIYDSILELNRRGYTILLVEQNAALALEVSNRGYVLQVGRVMLSGSAAELRHDPRVEELYLGRSGCGLGGS